jgi:C1A family cysteine protease
MVFQSGTWISIRNGGATYLATVVIAIACTIPQLTRPCAARIAADREESIACNAAASDTEDKRLAEINRMIVEKGYRWTAGKTSASELGEEAREKLLGFIPPPDGWRDEKPPYPAPTRQIDFPVFDWREYGCVTPVKDQGGCGACWVFAATGQMEAHILIYDGRGEDLSEQHVIDCNALSFGCDGGWHWTALDLLRTEGSVRESCYPYLEEDGHICRQSLCGIVARISDFAKVDDNQSSVDAIKQALLDGPVSTAIAMPCEAFYYTGGLLESDTAEDLNHVVVIVGWDDTRYSGAGAWICKNRWGTGGGENGYFYVRYGACSIGTHCYQIEYEPSVRLLSPNGGELLCAGRDYRITWRTVFEAPDSFSISLSLDGGQSFDHSVKRGLVDVSSFLWKPPDVQSSSLRIKIESYLFGGLLGRDVSDDDFTIKIVDFLDPSYPNPFNGTTTIPYAVERPGTVTIAIYDITGRLVTVLKRDTHEPGVYTVEWDGTGGEGGGAAPGVYFCRIEASGFSDTRKIVYIR